MTVVNEKSNTPVAGFAVVFKGSCANETPENFGISHLMEHLQYKNVLPLLKEFEEQGIVGNAYTDHSHIAFHMHGLEKYTKKYREKFLDRILNFAVTEELLKKEVQIVLQEYANYYNNQQESHYLNILRKKFGYYGPLGSREVLEKLTVEDCYQYYLKQYSKPDMIINIASDEFETGVSFSDRNFDNWKLKEESVPVEKLNEFESIVTVVGETKISSDFREAKLLCYIWGNGLDSPLYKLIREEKGLVYFISCYLDTITSSQAVFVVGSEMEEKNIDEFKKCAQEVLERDLPEERFETVLKCITAKEEMSTIFNFSRFARHISPELYLGMDYLKTVNYDLLNNFHKNNTKSLDFTTYKEI